MQVTEIASYVEVPAAESGVSALSWGAIVGGALAAAAASLVLLSLGAGLGFAALSPWSNGAASSTGFGVAAAVWLIVTQWLSSAFGGYLAGRTRTRWNGLHSDESMFRDTAHGFLSWALASVLAAGLLGAVGAAGALKATEIGTAGVQGAAETAGPGGASVQLWTDRLLRSKTPGGLIAPPEARAESGRILMAELQNGNLAEPDKAYLVQTIANITQLSSTDALKRVDEILQQIAAARAAALEKADLARKAAAQAAFYTAFSMLIGAFIAGAAGAVGGMHREHLHPRRS